MMHRDQIAIEYSQARNILDGDIWCHWQRESCLSASKKMVDRQCIYKKEERTKQTPWGTPEITGRVEELQLLIHVLHVGICW